MMSQDLRDALIYALQNPEQFQSYVVNITVEDATHTYQEATGIKFTKDDMLLGTADHNRPLYITGECEGRHLNRILVDSGSSINIIPLRVLQSLTLNAKPLVKENVLIHGFNQSSQKALGSVVLNMKFGELMALTKFFVIDAGTSYKALLGRPWLHQNGVVSSTLHQCMKYVSGGEEKRINGDVKPFGVHEITLTDARYFLNSEEKQAVKSLTKNAIDSPQPVAKPKTKRNVTRSKPALGSSFDELSENELKERKKSYNLRMTRSHQKQPMTRKVPALGSSSEDDDSFELIEEETLKSLVQTSEEESQEEMTRFPSPDSDDESVLFVDKVPHRCVKDLIPREVCVIQKLQIFRVPAKVSIVNRKIIHQNPIIFYKADTVQPGSREKKQRLKNEDGENSNLEYVSIDVSLYSGKNQGRLLKKLNCPTSIPKAQMERFNKMWNSTQRTITDIDGQTKNTRGLGYHFDEDIQYASPSVHFNGYLEVGPATSPFNHFFCNMVTDGLDEEGIPDDAKQAPRELDDSKTQNTIDELVEVDLGTEKKPRPTYISASLSAENKDTLVALLREYVDCFAWSYEEMPGLSPKVAVHKLKIDPAIKPVKQAPRRMRIELEEKVVEETKKLIDAGFIREEENPEWVASIVPVKKKNGQIRICVDFRDLNKACPKDEFPLPVTEIIINHTSSYEIFSFMDGYAGYNQIKMDEED